MAEVRFEKTEGEPHFILMGRNLHAPAVMRMLAAKTRVTDPEAAAGLDKLAGDFETWRRANPRAR